MRLPALIEAMRPHQWIKNGFVLAPLLFAQKAAELDKVRNSAAAFIAFALASGAIYLFNDVMDRERDRRHPEKKNRPIASGRLSVESALTTSLILVLFAFGFAWIVDHRVLLITGLYVALQIAYCLKLKHVVIIDVMAVAIGFVLRVLAGAAAVDVAASEWLILCTLLLALFLGFAKRRHEIVALGGDSTEHRKVLNDYSLALLDQISAVLLGSTIVCYVLYTISDRTRADVSPHLGYSVLFVIYGLLRYLHIVHKGQYAGSPTMALLKDRGLLFCVVLWALFCAAAIYLGPAVG